MQVLPATTCGSCAQDRRHVQGWEVWRLNNLSPFTWWHPEDCLVVERWGQLNLHPHPPCCVDSLTPLHPHSRVPFCGGEGIILILQNAQQLIKSRRPRLWGSFACEWGW